MSQPRAPQSLLKVLLRHRHLQTHSAFTAEYEKVARRIDRSLVGSAPGREQLQRWLSGRVKTLPRPHHCRVLELMFPGHSARELLQPYDRTTSVDPSSDQTSASPADDPSLEPDLAGATGDRRLGNLGNLGDPGDPGNLGTLGALGDLEELADLTELAALTSSPDDPIELPGQNRQRDPSRQRGQHPQHVRLGRAALAPGVLAMVWRGPDALEATLDRSTISPTRLAYLDSEADRLGVQAVKVPPAALLEETLQLVTGVRGLLAERQPAAVQRQLARIGAKLATVVGEILWNENQLVAARRWYQAASRSAVEAGDQMLADLALAGSTYLPTYGGDPRGVLRAIEPRLDAAPGTCAPGPSTPEASTSTPALAWLWAFRARAHAALGERLAFEHAIDQARATLERSPRDLVHPGIFSFLPEKLAFYEAHGRIDLRDAEGARLAALDALARYDPTDTTEPALTRFEYASALAQEGRTDEACRVATQALTDPHAYRATAVVIRAREFDRLLGPTTRVTRDWREFLADVRLPDPTALAGSF